MSDAETELFTWNQLFLGVMIFNTCIYILGYFILKDISIVDITWGVMFLIPNSMLLWQMTEYSPVHWLTFAMVGIWGVRLSLHICRRHKGEDYRYVQMRQRWTKCAPFEWFFCWLNVYFLQGLFSHFVTGMIQKCLNVMQVLIEFVI